MAKTKIYTRGDRREPRELRNLSISAGVNRYAEGSCRIELGHTQVLCLASVVEEVPPWREALGEGWVTAEYAMLPRATHTRSSRESVKGKVGGRTQEISRLIGRALRAVVDFKKLGPRTVTLDCEVLQADGGTRCAGITGGYIALALACQKIMDQNKIKDWPLKDSVAAVSVGLLNKILLLDLCYEEDSAAEVDMNVVMTGSGKLIEVQGTAEKEPFSIQQSIEMLEMAAQGVETLTGFQNKVLK